MIPSAPSYLAQRTKNYTLFGKIADGAIIATTGIERILPRVIGVVIAARRQIAQIDRLITALIVVAGIVATTIANVAATRGRE